MTAVCICGGGHIAHILAAVIGAAGCEVSLLTRRPQCWSDTIEARAGDQAVRGAVRATADPAMALRGAKMVLIAAPAFAHGDILAAVAPFVAPGTCVGALPSPGGFDLLAANLLPSGVVLFGSPRSPFNGRIAAYGAVVEVQGIAPALEVAVAPASAAPQLEEMLGHLLSIPVRAGLPFLATALSPATSIFHCSRLGELAGYSGDALPTFYGDWGDGASRRYLACDRELARLRARLDIHHPDAEAAVHYGVDAPAALTRRIRGLSGLPRVAAPLVPTSGGWGLEPEHRFLREDVPFGLRVLLRLADLAYVEMPATIALMEEIESALPEGQSLPGLPAHLGALPLSTWRR